MAAAGAIQAATLDLMQEQHPARDQHRELDEIAERFIRSHGAEPTFKGYRASPARSAHRPTP